MAKALEDKIIEQLERPVVDAIRFEPTGRRVRVTVSYTHLTLPTICSV